MLSSCLALSFAYPQNVSAETDGSDADQSAMVLKDLRIAGLVPGEDPDSAYTDWHFSEKDGCFYVFLPASADRSSLLISYDTEDDSTIYLGDTEVISGEFSDVLNLSDEFIIKTENAELCTLKVIQSELSAMFITSDEGNMNEFLKKRDLVKEGTALITDSTGTEKYSVKLDKITGHGNSSWNYSDKKSYNIKLSEKADLFGMGKAKKWMLISNSLDQSLIRNSVAIGLSRAAGVIPVLESEYIDLYADGDYKGTYQLYERVEIQKNRINITDLEEKTEKVNEKDLDKYERLVENADSPNDYIEGSCKYYDIPNDPDDITGGYLLEFQIWNRYGSKASSGFVTTRGQAIELKSPEYASAAQMKYIRTFVQDMEDAVYSDTGYNSKGKHFSEYIDTESLARAYLVQEITMNIDATFASFFLWKDSDLTGDGKIHFGPSWDFDLSINNFYTYYGNGEGTVSYSSKPDNIFVANFPVNGYKLHDYDTGSGRYAEGLSFISRLYRRREFKRLAAKIYFEDCEPYLKSLCFSSGGVPSLIRTMTENIDTSAVMNDLRWGTFGTHPFGRSTGNSINECTDFVSEFLIKRKLYLSELWLPAANAGDVNADGTVTAADVLDLKTFLLDAENKTEINRSFADMNEDGTVNVLDFSLLKSEIIHFAS